MTATNKCYNFVGFRCRVPLINHWVKSALIVGMIKDYVIVTIIYLNAFYREGQMIGYTLIISNNSYC